MKKLLSFFALSIFIYSTSFSQCGFDIERLKLQQNPEHLKQEKSFEQKIQHNIKNRRFNDKIGSVYTIPVVVHVLHLGEAIGSGTNISDAQIQSGIDRLNEVYRGLDPNSPIDFEVEFSLAKRDPNCNATTGINRINASGVANYSTGGVFFQSTGADQNTLKDLSRWSETDYFNIWIVSEIDGNNGGSGFQGYANFFYGNAYEGSVMMYTVFGYDPSNAHPSWPLTSFRDNSTPIHEFGHYFHLYHTFQGDNDNTTCPGDIEAGTDSDGCADTEIHKRHTSTCPTNNDCNSNQPYNDNTLKNYMSYFSCVDRLTNDQKTRVRAALANTSIVSSRGAEAPDVSYVSPVAVCSITSPQTNNSGIINVELNDVNMSSFSSLSDGGSIDESGNCSRYFEIDASISNTLNVDVFPANFQQLGVWIDWNDDGDFDDDSEQQHLSEDIAASSTVAIILDYPTSIPYGDYVRIRLITDVDDQYGVADINSSCYTPLFGQSEDYAIHIEPASGIAPVAEFSGSSTTLCETNTVSFTDASTNSPTSWNWSFTGGTPSSSTDQNPTITYNTAGTYPVTLTATNASGSGVETKIGYITVNACQTQLRVSDCGLSMVSYSNFIICNQVINATEYEYEFTNVGLSFSQTVLKTNPNYRFVYVNDITGIQNSTTYDVRIRAKVNGVFTAYGNTCQITTPASDITTQLRTSDCGINMSSYSNYILCDYVNGATEYEYEFTNAGLGFNQTVLKTNPFYRFIYVNDVTGIQNNTTYDVRVRAKVNGVFTSYGNTCQITTPASDLTTKLRTNDCGITMSSYSNYILCDYINGATEYEYEFTNAGLGFTQTLLRTNPTYRFAYVNNVSGILNSTTYDVRVRAKVNGVFIPYGNSCQITTPSAARIGTFSKEESGEPIVNNMITNLDMAIYPNPNQGEFVYLELQGLEANAEILINDISGKSVHQQTITSDYKSYNGTLRFDQKLNSGLYFVVLTSKNQQIIKKLVVQ